MLIQVIISEVDKIKGFYTRHVKLSGTWYPTEVGRGHEEKQNRLSSFLWVTLEKHTISVKTYFP